MTSSPDDSLLEYAKRATEEYEQRKREQEALHKAARERFLKAATTIENGCSSAHINVAHLLQDAAKGDYGSIMGILDKASLPEGMSFGIKECEMESNSLGEESKPFVRTPDGKRKYTIFKYFRFEDSVMGAWQAFLLHQLWHYLPLWWHANYDRRIYVYSKEDLPVTPLGQAMVDPGLRRYMLMMKSNVDSLDMANLDLAPELYYGNGKAYVSCCFWSEFGGLIREYVELTFAEGMLEDYFFTEEKTLFKYDCGICF